MRLCASCMLAAAVASTAAGGMVCVTGVVESQQVIAGGSGSNFTNETSQAISATIASTSTGVPPGTTDPRCARYCYPCGAGTGFNLCTAAEAAAGGKAIYTFVTRSTADAMATQPTKFRNLMVCETDNCNTVTTKLCDLANISAASAAGSDSKSAIPFADTKCLLADFVAVSGLCSGKRVRVSSCSSKASVAQFEVLASKRMNSYTTQECLITTQCARCWGERPEPRFAPRMMPVLAVRTLLRIAPATHIADIGAAMPQSCRAAAGMKGSSSEGLESSVWE